ncbi:uncharacterized protein LOC127101223 [Lathyrus oleraceus]|uniref:uncharacterized protein LOC127101223 n=1 Tax=Pisum sativum TaxID=3888 RepID=UPI0021CE97FB|nr:uncharacterized protein LOC127101223 [Pisum sativum]
MCPTYQHDDSSDHFSPNYSPPYSSSSPSAETQNRPLQLSYILQFSGATTSRADAGASTSRAGAAASTSTGNGTSTENGFYEPTGASTSSTNGFYGPTGPSTSTGHGFSGDAGASTSSTNGFSGPTGSGFSGLSSASTSSRNGFHRPTGASASSGNGFYGPAGAAAMVLVKDAEDRDEHAVVLHRFRQGLGNQTISVAQYRGLILGLTESLRKGYTEISVQGNSELVINQFLGNWEIDDPELRSLCDEALELRNSFQSFSINHIDQNLSREVDDEAVRAISLPDGQIEEEPQPHA